MAGLLLPIGNRKYSSWSLRPWIVMKQAGIKFDEKFVALQQPDTKAKILKFSPSGKVPFLRHGKIEVWESLAILEYLAEKNPEAGLWPRDARARAHARAICSEMHAGFQPLRRQFPMNMRRPVKAHELNADAASDVRRIETLWGDCRARFGQGGPFLYGAFGAADAMYAPVVSRFHTYGVEVGGATRDYMRAITALPEWSEWREAARREPWVIPQDEIDWPAAPRE